MTHADFPLGNLVLNINHKLTDKKPCITKLRAQMILRFWLEEYALANEQFWAALHVAYNGDVTFVVNSTNLEKFLAHEQTVAD